MDKPISLRVASPADAPRLLEIYTPYIKDTVITFECTVPSVSEFKQRMATIQQRYPYIVAERDQRIVGYAYLSPFVGRDAYGWAAETSIYVDPADRHGGIGGRLYQAIEEISRAMGILNLNACIGYPKSANDPHLTTNSADFHRHLGYRLVGKFHDCGYKFGHWYDMIWMEKMLGDHPENPALVKNFNDLRQLIADQYHIQ